MRDYFGVVLLGLIIALLLSLIIWPQAAGRAVRRVRFSFLVFSTSAASGESDTRRTRTVAAILLIPALLGLFASLWVAPNDTPMSFVSYDNSAVPDGAASSVLLIGRVVPFQRQRTFLSSQEPPIYVFFSNRNVESKIFGWKWTVNGKTLGGGTGEVVPRYNYVELRPNTNSFEVGDHQVTIYTDTGQPLAAVNFRVVGQAPVISR